MPNTVVRLRLALAPIAFAFACTGAPEETVSASAGESTQSATTSDLPTSTSSEGTSGVTTEASSTTAGGSTTAESSSGDPSGADLPDELTVLASGYARSRPLRVHGDFVYWASFGPDPDGTGRVLRVPTAGGAVETLAEGLSAPMDLVVTADAVIWGDYATGIVARAPLAGGVTSLVAEGYPKVIALAHDEAHLYWVTGGAGGALARAPLAGGPSEALQQGLDLASAIVLLPTEVAWVENGATAQIRAMPKGGGPIREITAVAGTSRSLLAADPYLYWLTVTPGGGVFRAPLDGGPAEPLVLPEIPGLFGLALDDTRLYWADLTARALYYADLSGDGVTPWVDGLMRPENLALTATHVYFTDFDAGELLRIGKP